MPVRTGDIWDPLVLNTLIDERFQFPLNIDEEDVRIDEIVNDLRSTCERSYVVSAWNAWDDLHYYICPPNTFVDKPSGKPAGKPVFRSGAMDKILDVDENGWNDVLNMG